MQSGRSARRGRASRQPPITECSGSMSVREMDGPGLKPENAEHQVTGLNSARNLNPAEHLTEALLCQKVHAPGQCPRRPRKAAGSPPEARQVRFHRNPVLQIAQSRSCLYTLGPKVGMIYILGAPGEQTKPTFGCRCIKPRASTRPPILSNLKVVSDAKRAGRPGAQQMCKRGRKAYPEAVL